MMRMSCDVSEATEGLENEQSLILQTLPSLHLRHSSFFNPSVVSPTTQLILLPFSRLTYVTAHSTTLLSLHLRHRHFTYVTWRAPHAGVKYQFHQGLPGKRFRKRLLPSSALLRLMVIHRSSRWLHGWLYPS